MDDPVQNRYLGFNFRSDGWFIDDNGEPCSLFGVVEFGTFLRTLDAAFESPIGRKVIYAAADAEEAILGGNERFRAGKWFGKRRVQTNFEQRAIAMGWGVFNDGSVSAPCHDGLCVGIALAHKEQMSGKRWKIDWRQVNTDLINITFEPHAQPMTLPRPVDAEPWSFPRSPPPTSLNIHPDFELRPYGFFLNEERSFLLNTTTMHRLFFELIGRPPQRTSELKRQCVLDGTVDHPVVFSAVFNAAKAAFNQSEVPVYVQVTHDWKDHFHGRITSHGLGSVTVDSTVLDGGQESIFHIQSPLLPYACGVVTAMWERAHGSKGHASVSKSENGVVLKVIFPSVDY